MGCDGGSIPKRDELVKTKQKEERPDRQSQQIAKWFHCQLSKQLLREPIVACSLGRLYNKDAIYEFLLDPTSHGDGDQICPHVRKPRDVVTLKLTANPAALTEKQSTSEGVQVASFICPITMREMNGNAPFCFLWTCGCVFSEQALKEIPSQQCIQCGKSFADEDVIPMNSDAEQLEVLIEKMKQRKQALKAHKKSKEKRKASEIEDEPGTLKDAAEKAGMKPDVTTKKQLLTIGPLSASQPISGAKKVSFEEKNDPSVPKVIQAKQSSKAIQSIYKSSQKQTDQSKGNWLTQGTFNRY